MVAFAPGVAKMEFVARRGRGMDGAERAARLLDTAAAGRRLIRDWLPVAALGEESVRERRSMTALPPTYYLHVWWARRPLVASRAAVLASVLPAGADRVRFMHALGIHGDPMKVKLLLDQARRSGERIPAPYTWRRAFTHAPDEADRAWLAEPATARVAEHRLPLNGKVASSSSGETSAAPTYLHQPVRTIHAPQ